MHPIIIEIVLLSEREHYALALSIKSTYCVLPIGSVKIDLQKF